MPEYLENPRRVPRVPVRCKARLFLASGAVDTTTEDIGSRGCRVVISSAVQRGDVVGLALSAPRFAMTLRVDGRVAWVSPAPPWQVGIAYAAQALPGAAQWMEGLRQAAPELFAGRRPPERLAVDAMIFLGPAPRLPDFREDELTVLRTVGAGVRVADLRTALSRTWPRMQRALFTLVAQGHVILSRAAAAHPVAWKHILGDPLRAGPGAAGGAPEGRALPLEDEPPAPAPAPRAATPAPASVTAKVPIVTVPSKPPPLPPPTRPAAPRQSTPSPTPVPAAQAAVPQPPQHAGHAEPGQHEGPPKPDFVGAGVGWRAPARPRSAEAASLLELGMAELEAHRPHGALALLRRALSLAPGDAEIATAIGRAMRGGDERQP